MRRKPRCTKIKYSNLEDAGFEGMRVQIELQPARARLVKVGM